MKIQFILTAIYLFLAQLSYCQTNSIKPYDRVSGNYLVLKADTYENGKFIGSSPVSFTHAMGSMTYLINVKHVKQDQLVLTPKISTDGKTFPSTKMTNLSLRKSARGYDILYAKSKFGSIVGDTLLLDIVKANGSILKRVIQTAVKTR